MKKVFVILVVSLSFLLVGCKNKSVEELQEEMLIERDKNISNSYNIVSKDEEVYGVDISSWQGDIDFESLSKYIDFVMIRLGYRGTNVNEIKEDKKFRENIEGALKYNIPVGIYFYSTADGEYEALEEASFVLNIIKDYKITYPVVYDYELFDDENIDIDLINKNAKTFLDYIKNHGYTAMLYTNESALKDYWQIEDYDIWLAHYGDIKEGYKMVQYANDGNVVGINGDVDLDVSYVSYEIKE